MIKIQELMTLIAVYGEDVTFKDLLEREMEKTPYMCPKCKGKGIERVRYNAYPSGFPDSGWVEDMKTKAVECDLCKGVGYTKEKYQPKMVQQGWEATND